MLVEYAPEDFTVDLEYGESVLVLVRLLTNLNVLLA